MFAKRILGILEMASGWSLDVSCIMQKSTKLVKIKLERTLVINRGLNWGG